TKFSEYDSKPSAGETAFRINIKFDNGSEQPIDLDDFSVLAEGKDWSLARFERHLPDTVCDVGPGEGTYAKLFRPVHKGVW
ncbi:hypothetical protein KBZ21_41395, partial [Streptomyces sp. A73]|nr:hypothetical protein [Streptomyces sp. A73]